MGACQVIIQKSDHGPELLSTSPGWRIGDTLSMGACQVIIQKSDHGPQSFSAHPRGGG